MSKTTTLYSLSLPERILLKIYLSEISSFSDCLKIFTKARRSCFLSPFDSFSSLGELMLPSLYLSSFVWFFHKIILNSAMWSLSHTTHSTIKKVVLEEIVPIPFYAIVYLLKMVVVFNWQDKCTLFTGATTCFTRHGLPVTWFATLLLLIKIMCAHMFFLVSSFTICFLNIVFMSWLFGSYSLMEFLTQTTVYQLVSLELSQYFVFGFNPGFSSTSFSSMACAPSFPIHDLTSALSHLHCVLLMMRWQESPCIVVWGFCCWALYLLLDGVWYADSCEQWLC